MTEEITVSSKDITNYRQNTIMKKTMIQIVFTILNTDKFQQIKYKIVMLMLNSICDIKSDMRRINVYTLFIMLLIHIMK